MFKREKGITLVALVVTIIILLILAGVALTIALGENGLFNQAQNAATSYKKASQNDTTGMELATNTMFEIIANITAENQ